MATTAKYSVITEYKAIDLVTKTINVMSNATNKYEKTVKKAFDIAKSSSSGAFSKMRSGISRVNIGFRNAFRNMNQWSNSTGNAFNKASNDVRMFGNIFKAVLSFDILRTSMRRLKSMLRGSVKAFADYGMQIALAAQKFAGINRATEAGRKSFENYRAEILKFGDSTEYGATQAAKAWGILGSAGFKSVPSFKVLPATLDLARGTGIPGLKEAADLTSSAMVAFGLRVEDNDRLVANYLRTTDMLSLALRRTKIDYNGLTQLIKGTGNTFKAKGGSLSEFLSLVVAIGRAGIPVNDLSRAILNLQMRLVSSDKKVQDSLKMLGVQTADTHGRLRPITDIFADMEKGIKSMSQLKGAMLIANILGGGITGQRSLEAITAAMREGTTSIKEFRRMMDQSIGASKSAGDIIGGELSIKIDRFMNSVNNLGKRFVIAFENRGKNALDKLINSVNNFSLDGVIEITNTAINVFTSLFKVINAGSGAIKLFIFWGLAYVTLIKLWAIAGAIQFWVSLITMIRSATDAMIVFNWITNLNPMMLIISGLIVGIILIWRNWDRVSKAIEGAYNWLVKFVQKINPFSDSIEKMTPKIEEANGNAARIGAAEQSETFKLLEENLLNRFREGLRAKDINFSGRLEIAGATEGTTFTGNTFGAPDIDVNILGDNS